MVEQNKVRKHYINTILITALFTILSTMLNCVLSTSEFYTNFCHLFYIQTFSIEYDVTHLWPMCSIYIPRKYQKTNRFSVIFREYKTRTCAAKVEMPEMPGKSSQLSLYGIVENTHDQMLLCLDTFNCNNLKKNFHLNLRDKKCAPQSKYQL